MDKIARENYVRLISEYTPMAINNSYKQASAVDAAFLTKSSTTTSVPPDMVQAMDPTPPTSDVPIISQTEPPATTAQPPVLSTTLLILITGGVLLLLSLLALMFYCYVRFRRRSQARRCTTSDEGRELEDRREKRRWIGNTEGGKMNSGCSISSSAFDFSPPSPTWRPILPSLAFASRKNVSHMHLANSEEIVLEREHGGCTGRGRQRNGGAFATSGTLSTANHYQHPATGTAPMRGIVGVKNPALSSPSTAPRTYRPPAYHYSSRIVPPSKNCIDATSNSSQKKSASSTHSMTPALPIPRIRAQCAQDPPTRIPTAHAYYHTLSNGMHHFPASGEVETKSGGLMVKKADSVKTSRPNSGLGITMMDLSIDEKRYTPSASQLASSGPHLFTQPMVNSCKASTALSTNEYTSLGYGSGIEAAPALPLPVNKRDTNRTNTSWRQGVCEDSITTSVKNELYKLRSLGSESSDNLIEYLADNSKRMPEVGKGSTLKNSQETDRFNGRKLRVTREETEEIDYEAYEEWTRNLNATPALHLGHADVDLNDKKRTQGNSNLNHKSRNAIIKEAPRSRRENCSKTDSTSSTQKTLKEIDTNTMLKSGHIQEENTEVSRTGRTSEREKSSMHVRALRARSALLKGNNQTKVNSMRYLESDSSDTAQPYSNNYPDNEINNRLLKTATSLNVKQTSRKHPRDNLATTGNQALSTLPSFSIPSSATQLYVTFPSTEASLSANQPVSSANSKNTPCYSVPKNASTSQSSNSMSMSTAAYIARCASTPHSKPSAFLPFLSPSPPSIHRQSIDSVSSAGSDMSSWGRRSDWGRESLTPRFNHLRAVLEGQFEDPPPPPPLPTDTRLKSCDEHLALDRSNLTGSVSRPNTLNEWL